MTKAFAQGEALADLGYSCCQKPVSRSVKREWQVEAQDVGFDFQSCFDSHRELVDAKEELGKTWCLLLPL